jgi:ParB-like chromosome segregation protein Spo0J
MTARSIAIGAVTTRPPFSDLFDIKPETLNDVVTSMRTRGYDDSEPMLIWPVHGERVVIDGHTRFQAAGIAGLEEVTISEQSFDSELSALQAALRRQTGKRNLTDEEKTRAVLLVDERLRQALGGTGANQYNRSAAGSSEPAAQIGLRSAAVVAELTGTSESTVKRIRLIADDPTGEAMREVRAGASISGAATRAKARKKPAGASKPSNGLTPVKTIQRHDKEDWYRVRSAGHTAETTLFVAARDIQAEIDKLNAQGIDPTQFMHNRRVSPNWNKALKEANRIAALLRSVLRANEDG